MSAAAALAAAGGLCAACRYGGHAGAPERAAPDAFPPGAVTLVLRRDRSPMRWEQAGQHPNPAPIVRATVQGRTVLALVDTGASLTLIDADSARRVGVRPRPGPVARIGAQGLGARSTADVAVVGDLRLGDLWLSNVVVAIAAPGTGLGVTDGGWGRRVDMTIGTDVLRMAERMLWDGPGFRVVLAPTDAESNLPVRVPLDPIAPLPVVPNVEVGTAVLPLAFDTGGDFAVWVPGPLARAVGLPFPPFDARPPPTYGFGGRVIALPAGAVDIRIGPRCWPKTALLIGATGQGHAHLPFGLVGRRVFGLEQVLFDFAGREIRLSR